jgi:hypothetical protein
VTLLIYPLRRAPNPQTILGCHRPQAFCGAVSFQKRDPGLYGLTYRSLCVHHLAGRDVDEFFVRHEQQTLLSTKG